MRAEAEDLAATDRRDQGLVPELLPGVDVGKVNFDGGDSGGGNGITQRNTGMGVGRSVENDDVELVFCLLNPGDEFACEIGLAEVDVGSGFSGTLADLGFDIGQGGPSVQLRLALAEEVQVGAIEKEDLHSRWRRLGMGFGFVYVI